MKPESACSRLWILRQKKLLALAAVVLLPAACNSGNTPSQPEPGAVPNSSKALFEDVTQKAGIGFKHSNGATGKFHFIELTPAGCAVFDYDKDGFLDLFFAQSGPSEPPAAISARPSSALYRNRGDGTFEEKTAGSGLDANLGYAHGAAAADYDNDGYTDLFVTSFGRNFLFHNKGGTGRFEDVTEPMGLAAPHSSPYATSAAFGDYDRDGKLDLYVCYYVPWDWKTDKPCSNSRNEREYCTPELYEPAAHQLFHNEGIRFRDVSKQSGIASERGRGLAVAFWDYDSDNDEDIYVANDLTSAFLWENDGKGTFRNVALERDCAYDGWGRVMAGMGIGIADYDQSGRESLFVTNFSGKPNMLFHNLGGKFKDRSNESGLAQPHMNYLAFGCEFLDYNLDGFEDLVVANGHVQVNVENVTEHITYKEPTQLFRNAGNGTFQEIVAPEELGPLSIRSVSRGLAKGDLDNDGQVDVVLCNQNEVPRLLRNRNVNGNGWINLQLEGVKSNRDAIGAVVTLKAGGVIRVTSVRGGSSYLSTSDRRVHIGLGQAKTIESVTIRWPSGLVQKLRDIEPASFYRVLEGSGARKLHAAGKPDASNG